MNTPIVFTDLPDDVVTEILSYSELSELISQSSVSQRMRRIVTAGGWPDHIIEIGDTRTLESLAVFNFAHYIDDDYNVFGIPECRLYTARFSRATSVTLNSCNITDNDAAQLGRLQMLNLYACQHLTDACTAYLGAIHTLSLSFCNITDTGAANLGSVACLDLSGTKITNIGVKHLGNVARLELSFTSVTDEGLAYLGNVEEILLIQCYIRGPGLAHLRAWKVALSCTDIDDAGLQCLSAGSDGLRYVSSLWISECWQLTSAGLCGFSSLEFLDIRWTAIDMARVVGLGTSCIVTANNSKALLR